MRFYATHLILFVNFSTGKIGWLLRSLKVKKEKKRIQHLFPYRRLYTELLDADIRNSPRIVYRFFCLYFCFLPLSFGIVKSRLKYWSCEFHPMSSISDASLLRRHFWPLLFRTRSNPINCLFAAIVVSLSRFNQTNAKDSDKVRYFLNTLYRFHGEYPQSNISSILNKSRDIFWLSIF